TRGWGRRHGAILTRTSLKRAGCGGQASRLRRVRFERKGRIFGQKDAFSGQKTGFLFTSKTIGLKRILLILHWIQFTKPRQTLKMWGGGVGGGQNRPLRGGSAPPLAGLCRHSRGSHESIVRPERQILRSIGPGEKRAGKVAGRPSPDRRRAERKRERPVRQGAGNALWAVALGPGSSQGRSAKAGRHQGTNLL